MTVLHRVKVGILLFQVPGKFKRSRYVGIGDSPSDLEVNTVWNGSETHGLLSEITPCIGLILSSTDYRNRSPTLTRIGEVARNPESRVSLGRIKARPVRRQLEGNIFNLLITIYC